MDKKTSTTIVTILLVGGIVFLLLSFRSKEKGPNMTPAPSPSSSQVQTESPAVTAARLKAAQELIAANPWPDQVKFAQYSERISKEAVSTTSVDIIGCAPNPSVARLRDSKTLTFNNPDKVTHKILYGSGNVVEVPAGSKKQVTFSALGSGIFPYRCDNQLAGILVSSK